MLDKFLALISVACLIGFLGIIVWFVPDIDLVVVTILVVAMAVFDFYRELFSNKANDSRR